MVNMFKLILILIFMICCGCVNTSSQKYISQQNLQNDVQSEYFFGDGLIIYSWEF